jgi:hypothetical protein
MQVIALLPKCPQSLCFLAEGGLLFSPQVASTGEAVFIEVGQSHRLYSLPQILESLSRTLKEHQLEVQIGVAGDIPTALALARFKKRSREELPIAALRDYLYPFSKEDFPAVKIFEKLGISTIQDFLQLPRGELATRLGKPGSLAYERIMSAHSLPWPRWQPEEKIEAYVELDFAAQVETIEPIVFLLKKLVDQVFLRLKARGLAMLEARLTFHLSRFSEDKIVSLDLPFSLPQAEAKAVLFLLLERVQSYWQKKPLPAALEAIRLSAERTCADNGTKRDFFSKIEAEKELWASISLRLMERLGHGKAFQARALPRRLPEASWEKSMEGSAEGALAKQPLRPLRILHPAPALERNRKRLWIATNPLRQWEIMGFSGPERLSGEWWLDGFSRDYFHVDTHLGAPLWIYKSQDKLFLQGIFD